MLVSNFSLGFTDYYQFESGWTAGYLLQITNLADQEIVFDVECRITRYYFGGTGPGESVASSLGSMLGGAWHSDADGYYQQQTLTIGANRSEQYHLQPWSIRAASGRPMSTAMSCCGCRSYARGRRPTRWCHRRRCRSRCC